MSFFKKMVDKFEDVVGGDDKKKTEQHEGTKDHGQQPADHGTQQQSFYQPPHPAPPSGPMGGPQLPPGWISQWDQNSQRYYYVEQATGRTQWEPPQSPMASHGGYPPPMGPPMGLQGYEGQGQHGPSGGYYSQEVKHTVDSHGGQHKEVHEKKEKKDGKGGMLAAGAGGLAVGAVGGALVGHAMGDDSSDDEHKGYAAPQQPAYVQQTTYYQEGPPPPMAPPPGSDQGSISSSDKEDLQEAREEYENASASDREEAREEYQEEYEEAYGSD